jgi:hypothetical protein
MDTRHWLMTVALIALLPHAAFADDELDARPRTPPTTHPPPTTQPLNKRKTEVENRKAEVENRKAEVEDRKVELEDRKAELEQQALELANEKQQESNECNLFAIAVQARSEVDNGASKIDKLASSIEKGALPRGRRLACFHLKAKSSFQGGVEDIASTLLKTAGQIVVDRAVSNAWGLLSEKLKRAAGCEATPPTFPSTCRVLDHVRIQDVLASPTVFLDAAVHDLLAKLDTNLKQLDISTEFEHMKVDLGAILRAGIDAWQRGGRDAAVAALRSELLAVIAQVTTALETDCGDKPLCVALRAVGDCLVNGGQKARCTITTGMKSEARVLTSVIQQAVIDNNRQATVKLLMSLLREHIGPSGACPEQKDNPAIRLTCTQLIDALEDVLLGIVEEDWSRVAAGGVAALEAVTTGADRNRGKLFKLIGAVGQYTASYASKDAKDSEAGATARRKAIESLIDATTDRSDRDSGVVVSVGGAFGVGWGWKRGIRHDTDDVAAYPTPLHLSLGVGIDSYHGTSSLGFHGMLGIADLSQYVSFKDKDFQVADPDAKAALALGVTAGFRFALRQTPMFVGLNFTYSPFVQVADASDTMSTHTGSYQFILMSSVYVPFFDFN